MKVLLESCHVNMRWVLPSHSLTEKGSGNAAAFSRFAVTLLVDRVKILNDGNAEKLLSTRYYALCHAHEVVETKRFYSVRKRKYRIFSNPCPQSSL